MMVLRGRDRQPVKSLADVEPARQKTEMASI